MACLWEAVYHLPSVTSLWGVVKNRLFLQCAGQTIPWFRYLDNIFVVWRHGAERLQNLLKHLSSLRSPIQFTVGTELSSGIPFLNVPVIRKMASLATEVQGKHAHCGLYLINCTSFFFT